MRAGAALVILIGLVGQVFRADIDQVVVWATVHASHGEYAGALVREDFRVFDDGQRVPVTEFVHTRRSADIILLLDNSESLAGSLSDVQAVADSFLKAIPSGDRVLLGTFSNITRLAPDFATDASGLRALVPRTHGANLTTLYDALVEACDAFEPDDNRRVVLVVSDGSDTASTSGEGDVIEHAAKSDAVIYSIGVKSRFVTQGRSIALANEPSLRRLSEDTGGGYIAFTDSIDLERALDSMMEELHQSYLLGFQPTHADGRVHALAVKVLKPGLTVRARQHYFAPTR